MESFINPFRPGAGQQPPYLAGRKNETEKFKELLNQKPILKNLILTGLRGVGKTVLLETFKPIAQQDKWYWTGTDLSESAGNTEQSFSIRLLADLSVLISPFTIKEEEIRAIGFNSQSNLIETKYSYSFLHDIYSKTPGLEADKLKRVMEFVWDIVKDKVKGIILAYDEAQILKDKASEKQYPLSLLLEVIQFIQRKEIPYLLILTGLPTLYPNLIEARTYAERMFHVMNLTKLNEADTKEAISKPIDEKQTPVRFTELGVSEIIKYSSGYPYFIQFFCREAFDLFLQQKNMGITNPDIKISNFVQKLDSDFYAGRWGRVTERQKDLLFIIAKLSTANEEFTVKDIVTKSNEITNPFSQAYVSNTLVKLIDFGLIYKNSRGKYSFAVPLLADYINRQNSSVENMSDI
ncbi:ATP-binding protein [Aquirufa ecclesiirivi]|uniref:ATP-binding protein n=1 Tax=Aquirufa ecclesiirivi TaxID=2715124 RepID=UPI00140D9B17|nr:ATP-binding protein [Aquirufa ecclesiirivi]NHC49147.1 ATP-binding protein [Aquirufa ecclesiirivi]